VVSAVQLHEGEDLDGTFSDQVSSADLLLLHKVDLVPAASLDVLEARLAATNPDAPVFRARFGDVDPARLFPSGPGERAARRPKGQHHDHDHDHEAFETLELAVPEGLPEAEAYAWI